MSGDSTDFELDLQGNMAAVAKKMAAELSALESKLNSVASASKKLDKAQKPGSTRAFSPQQFNDLKNNANAVVRLQKAHRSLAPASSAAARGLRMLGISGAPLRRLSIDAAKSEIALRRLYRAKGGGLSGGAAVTGALARRGVGKYGGAVARGAGSLAMGAASMAGGAAMIGGGAALGAAGFIGFDMVKTAVDADRLRFALDRITNGNGAMWWAKSSEYAAKFGLDVNQVANSLMGMQATGLSGDTTMEMFQRFADMKSQGVGSNQIDMALLGFKQMMSNGVVQMEDLKQVTENLMLSRGLVMETVAKQMGKSVQEIQKMQLGGELKSTDMAKAISTAIGIQTKSPVAGGAGAAASSATVIGMWDKMQATWSVQAANALQGSAFVPVKEAMASFTNWMTGAGGQAAIGAFGGVIARLFAAAPQIIESVIWFLDTGLPAAWTAFSTAFSSSGGTAAWDALLGGAATLGGPGGAAVIANITGMATAVGNLAGSLVTLLNILMPIISGLATVAKYTAFAVPTILGAITGGPGNDNGAPATPGTIAASVQATNDGFNVGSAMASGMQAGMTYGAPGVASAAMLLGQAANDSLRTEEQIHSPGRKMMQLGQYEAQGYAQGMTRGIPTIESASGAMGSSASASTADAAPGGAGAGIVINVYLDGKEVSGKSDGEIGDLIGERIERKLASIFRQRAYNAA